MIRSCKSTTQPFLAENRPTGQNDRINDAVSLIVRCRRNAGEPLLRARGAQAPRASANLARQASFPRPPCNNVGNYRCSNAIRMIRIPIVGSDQPYTCANGMRTTVFRRQPRRFKNQGGSIAKCATASRCSWRPQSTSASLTTDTHTVTDFDISATIRSLRTRLIADRLTTTAPPVFF